MCDGCGENNCTNCLFQTEGDQTRSPVMGPRCHHKSVVTIREVCVCTKRVFP